MIPRHALNVKLNIFSDTSKLSDQAFTALSNAIADCVNDACNLALWRHETFGEDHPLTRDAWTAARAAGALSEILDPDKRLPLARRDY